MSRISTGAQIELVFFTLILLLNPFAVMLAAFQAFHRAGRPFLPISLIQNFRNFQLFLFDIPLVMISLDTFQLIVISLITLLYGTGDRPSATCDVLDTKITCNYANASIIDQIFHRGLSPLSR